MIDMEVMARERPLRAVFGWRQGFFT
jgi:hypothetical protein